MMAANLPPEIWRKIFYFATFTATSLNVTEWKPDWPMPTSRRQVLGLDPPPTHSYVLATRKSLALVSRVFHDIAIEFMFEMVELYHTHHAKLLADIIQTHPSSPSKWIKQLIVNVSEHGESDRMEVMVMRILSRCKVLTAFGWLSSEPPAYGTSEDSDEYDGSRLMKSIPASVTVLEWNRKSSGRSFQLRHLANLRMLRASNIVSICPEDLLLTVPSITHLDVQHPRTCINISEWKLPSLSHLTLGWMKLHHLEQFLCNNGDSIRSIYLTTQYVCTASYGLSPLIARVPKLVDFSYRIIVDNDNRGFFEGSWSGVGDHGCLTNIYIHCDGAIYNERIQSFSIIRTFFFNHIKPLLAAGTPLKKICVTNALDVFAKGNFRKDGYNRGDGERFFVDLTNSLSSPTVQVNISM